ncbi:MAG: hypothetical protein V1827_04540 [Candidatus Micrarchaeota archaeon]
MKHFFLVFILFAGLAQAQMALDSQAEGALLRISANIESNATNQAEFDAFLETHSLIVVGHDADLAEQLALDTARTQNPWLSKAPQVADDESALAAIRRGDYAVVMLIGGPEQNRITDTAILENWFNDTAEIEGGFIVKSGKLDHTLVVAISDKTGFSEDALKRVSASKSPLAAFVPEAYVPAAATGISLLLLVLFNVTRTVFEFKALDIGRKGKKAHEGVWMFHHINLTEILAVLGASLVLGISISWQYFGDDLWGWIAINTAICLIGAIIHEVSHRLFAHYFKIRMEYRFWPAGSLLTLVSSYLGNAFSIQGFILEEIPPETPKWQAGLMKLSAPVISAIVMCVFAYMYYLEPNPVYQIVYSTSALWAMAEMLPFGSLDGKDIKDWSPTVWGISFFLISSAYVIVTFFL